MTTVRLHVAQRRSKAPTKRAGQTFGSKVRAWLAAAVNWRRRQAPAWSDTVPEERPSRRTTRSTPKTALTQALDDTAEGRTTLRHLLIIEQTMEMTNGRLDDMPLAILQKALLELPLLTTGTQRAGIRAVKDLIKEQISRTDLRHFHHTSGGSIQWAASGLGAPDSDYPELLHGEFVDTARMPIDVQIAFEPTVLSDLAPYGRSRHE